MHEWSSEEKERIDNIEQQCFKDLLDQIKNAEASGNMVVFKEHIMLLSHPSIENQFIHGRQTTVREPQTLKGYPDGLSSARSPLNKTILSDEFLMTFKPTYLIRHPALTFPSIFGALQYEEFERPVKDFNISEISMY
jgi:hypothetical protein